MSNEVINWVDVAAVGEIPVGERKTMTIDELNLAVFNLDGEYYAIEDRCTHQNLPLADGLVEDNGNITCPYHGAVFCLKTGEVQAPPACENLVTFKVRVNNGRIQIKF